MIQEIPMLPMHNGHSSLTTSMLNGGTPVAVPFDG
jgi:hypothetical protein